MIKHIYIVAALIAAAILGGMALHAYISSGKAVAAYDAIKKDVTGQVAALQQQIAANDKQAAQRSAAIDAQLAAAKTAAQQLALIRQWAGQDRVIGQSGNRVIEEKTGDALPSATPTPGVVAPAPSPAGPNSAARQPAGGGAGATSLSAAEISAIAFKLADGEKCASELTACKSDLTDSDNQKQLLAKRASAAEAAMKGGSFWQRLKGNAKWLAIGGALGAAVMEAKR
jgi:hypothetical protein